MTVPPPLLVSPTSFAFDCTPADFPAGVDPAEPARSARLLPTASAAADSDASGRPPSKPASAFAAGAASSTSSPRCGTTLTESDFSSEAPGISTHGASEFPPITLTARTSAYPPPATPIANPS